MPPIDFFLLQPIFLLCIALPTMNLSNAAHILGNETDRLALLAVKDQITRDPLRVMNSWNSSIHFCEWEGVTCGQRHQRVIILDLQSKGMTGSISPYIGNLSFLRTADLRNNSFHSEIPQEVGRLFRLQILLTGNNSFSGQIPINLFNCSNLINLTISYNKLVGDIPQEFGSLSKLTRLALHDNALTGRIPVSFGNLSSLEALGLTENRFYGSIPDSLGKLERLEYISLAGNMFSGMVPRSLYNISSLQFISFAENKLEGNLPPDIGLNLPNLWGFYIGGNHFSGSIPISLLTNSSRIQNLELAINSFTGNVPAEVGSLKDLQVLGLANNALGSSSKEDDLHFLTSLNNCTYLQLVDIYGNRFGGRLPGSIVNLSSTFGYLYMGHNQIVGSIPREIGNLISIMLLSMESNFLSGIIPQGIGMLKNLQLLDLSANKFSGQIPKSIGNNSQLYLIDLSDNVLEGNVVSNVDKYQFLQQLNLSHNQLNCTIPKRLFELSTHLITLSLAHNSLTGPLHSEVGNLQNLQTLDISANKISGEIPASLGSCLSLEKLYLQGNFLEGVIPSSFTSLKGIQNLDLSRNNLSGEIFKSFEDLLSLKSLNLSFNNLEGEVPTKGVFRNVSAVSLVGNDKLCGGIRKLDLPKCHPKKYKRRGMCLALKVTLGVLVPLFVIASLLLVYYLTKRSATKPSSQDELVKSSLKRISYGELRKATDEFSSTNLIGVGSYGSVYKGVLNQNKGPIAVKVFNLIEKGASKSFMAECEVLRKVRHRNLLKILTVCSSLDYEGNEFKALVFEFMPNGSVENWLHPSSDTIRPSRYLDLQHRLNIAIDVASALDYLHNQCGTPIVHCDLKPSNVLLGEDMDAYVGDFGIAKFLSKTSSDSDRTESNFGMRGSIGYIPPEYGMGGQVSTQGDLYSYGILLLEMLTGKRPTNEMFTNGLNLHQWTKLALIEQGEMDIIDGRLLYQRSLSETNNDIEQKRYAIDQVRECINSMMNIGVALSSESIVERLEIKQVLVEMHSIRKKFIGIEVNVI